MTQEQHRTRYGSIGNMASTSKQWDIEEEDDGCTAGVSNAVVESRSESSCENGDEHQVLAERDFGPPPADKFLFVYFILMMNGIGVLLPWNMFITIAPQYYVDFWFSFNPDGSEDHYGRSFMSAMGIIAQIPNFLMALVSVAAIIKGPPMWKIAGSLTMNCLLVVVILALVIFQQPSAGAENWFYIVSLIIVMLMNASNGLYQNSMFGVAADFPFKYTNALVVGSNVCGTFTSVLQIVTTLGVNNPETLALIYFSVSLATLVICGFSLWVVSKLEFYKYYVGKGDYARALDNSERPSIRQYWDTIKYCWSDFLNIFLVYFVTLSVFPTILVGITPLTPQTGNLDKVWIGLTTFLNFNGFAAIGSTAAGFFQFPPKKLLFIPVFARLLFIPYFMLCNYDIGHRGWDPLLTSAWWFIIGNAVMAFTSGYLSSVGMMYAPSSAPPHLQKIAGQLAALALVGGIMAGVGFTPAITSMVENIK